MASEPASARYARALAQTRDLDKQIEQLYKGVLLSPQEVFELIKKAKELFQKEDNVVHVMAPVVVVGDIHGQFHDLAEVFKIAGRVPTTNYLFLGDYVDRGYYSLECAQLLLLLKLRHPRRVTLLRGNHESRQITQIYGFYEECRQKYRGAAVWKAFMTLFDTLPPAAVIAGRIFCVHGGLTPAAETLDAVRALDRFGELPAEGAMSDLMWSDPDEIPGWEVSPRGSGYFFGREASEEFLRRNGLSRIVRAHQLAMEGFTWWHGERVVTVFSAPNYCYRCGNKGAIMEVSGDLSFALTQFDAAPRRGEPPAAMRAPDYFV